MLRPISRVIPPRNFRPPRHVASPPADLIALARRVREQPPPTFLLGGPGSGKGTLANLLKHRHKVQHISVGALLRATASTTSPSTCPIHAALRTGSMVPATTSTRLLLNALLKRAQHAVCIIDGFPRNLESASLWEKLGLRPSLVVALEVEQSEMISRLKHRGREDDVPHVVQRRIDDFDDSWLPLKTFYGRRRVLVRLDAAGSPEQVWQRFVNQIPAFH